MENERLLTPSLKANMQDSLQFLMEINREIELLKNGTIQQDEFANYIQKRSVEWGYISDAKHTFKLLEQIHSM